MIVIKSIIAEYRKSHALNNAVNGSDRAGQMTHLRANNIAIAESFILIMLYEWLLVQIARRLATTAIN